MKRLLVLRVSAACLFLLSIGLGFVTLLSAHETRLSQDMSFGAILRYTMAERLLQLDLIDERAGILRNYDLITTQLASVTSDLDDLEQAGLNGRSQMLFEQLLVINEKQASLVDQFNSDNAVVQISLDYIAEHGADEPSDQLLLDHVLKLALDTTPSSVNEALAGLPHMQSAPDDSPGGRLRFHAQTLVAALPHMDATLSAIRGLRMEDRVTELQKAMRDNAENSVGRVVFMQAVFAAILCLLVVTVVALVMAQRGYARDLAAQVANERLNAAIAVPLIDAGSSSFAARVQDAINRLADHIGANRLQMVIPGLVDRVQYANGDALLEPDWLAAFSKAADADNLWTEDRVVAFRSHGVVGGELGRAMHKAGVVNLAMLRTGEPFRVVLGFEPDDVTVVERRDYLTGVASAIVAVAHGARREAMERERERLQQVLGQKRRMEKVGLIASGVAHNFNNIIAVIAGFAEMGHDIAGVGSSERQKFDDIRAAVRRASSLVDDILSYARQKRSRKRQLDLATVLSQGLELLKGAHQNGSRLQYHAPHKTIFVFGSVGDLQQVVFNICNNALQASDGGVVDISVSRQLCTDEQVLSHGALYPGLYAVIVVRDAGPGLSDAAHRQLFEPFFTTRAAGIGLGLSMAWEIVEDHGGTIDVKNRAEGGAQFSIMLPEIRENANGALIGRGARILLITETEQLPADEDLLAELGYEPVGLALEAAANVLLEALKGVDAVVVATWQTWRAEQIVQILAAAPQCSPLLVAMPDPASPAFPTWVRRIAYPLRAREISVLLAEEVQA